MSVAEEGAIWGAHERARGSVREAGDAAQRIASHAAKQRGMVDAALDRAIECSTNESERSFLRRRRQDLSDTVGSGDDRE